LKEQPRNPAEKNQLKDAELQFRPVHSEGSRHKAMRDFQHKCYNVLDAIGSTVTSTPQDSLQTELEMASLKLANTCGESIQEDFGVNDFEKVEEGVDVKLNPLRRRLHANPSPEP
jgi:hypothetical protein